MAALVSGRRRLVRLGLGAIAGTTLVAGVAVAAADHPGERSPLSCAGSRTLPIEVTADAGDRVAVRVTDAGHSPDFQLLFRVADPCVVPRVPSASR